MTVADQIIQVIEELCAKFGIAVDWTSEQVMPVLQDLISRYANYIILSKISFIILSVILEGGLIFAVCCVYRVYNDKNSKLYLDDGVESALSLFSIMAFVGLFFSIIFLPLFTKEVIQAITVPEITFLNGIIGILS